MKKREENWTSTGVEKMLCNPFYTGIRVHEQLVKDRPHDYNPEKFIQTAINTAQEIGNEACIRGFIRGLKHPVLWTLLIPVHPCFAEQREAIISEEEFIQAAVAQLRQGKTTIDRYFRNVAENLSQASIPLKKPEVVK